MIKFIRTILLVGRYNLLKKENGYKLFIPVILFIDLGFALFATNLLESIVKNYNGDTLDILFIVGISVYLISSFFAWYELFNHVADLPTEDTSSDVYGLNDFPKTITPKIKSKDSYSVVDTNYNRFSKHRKRIQNDDVTNNHNDGIDIGLGDILLGAAIYNSLTNNYTEESNINDNSDYNYTGDSSYNDNSSDYDNSSSYDSSDSSSFDSGGSDFGGGSDW